MTFIAQRAPARNGGAMTPDLQTIARALGGEMSGNCVRAPGPGHSRKDRSLAIEIKDHTLLVNTFSPRDDQRACFDYVVKQLGLDMRTNGNGAPAAEQFSKKKIVAEYTYTDQHGGPLYQVLRYEPKDFRQRRSDGNGGWIWTRGEQTVLYRWPELVKYPDATVFVCEGEKDADRVASLGHCATTISGGAKWTEECIAPLAGRDVVILEDADDAGRKRATEAAEALYGRANSIRVVRLPGLDGHTDSKDVSDWLDADPNRGGDALAEVCLAAPLWARPPKGGLPFIDMSKWDSEPTPRREWGVVDTIPLRQPTLFSGEGAIGKSLLELMRSAAHVLGKSWLGKITEPGPAIYLGAEDEENELHRRLADILAYYGATFAEAIAGGLHMLSYAGRDAILGAPNNRGFIEPTPLFNQLREAALDIRPKSITIDTVADVFAGNENDRSQVRQFVGMLRGLAIEANTALVICSHPSLTGINTGSGLSGSTGWHNSVRARMYLTAAATEKGEEPDPDLRELIFRRITMGRLPNVFCCAGNAGSSSPKPDARPLRNWQPISGWTSAFCNCSPSSHSRGAI
jgi:AAA domain/Toprim-like